MGSKQGSALAYDRRRVLRALGRMGFYFTGHQRQGDHAVFERGDGTVLYLPITGNGRQDIPHASLHAAGLQLERRGVMLRREFITSIKSLL